MNRDSAYFINRLREKLWLKPLIFCLLSIGAALLARLADNSNLEEYVPLIKTHSLEDLLGTISSTMLVISIFAVSSMISAYSAASSTATPRSFTLIVADDVSQNALSVFIGSFIFSIVASVALQNGYYGTSARFILFVLTLGIFVLVIITFLRWVQRISRLGRMGTTIEKIEDATKKAIVARVAAPFLGGIQIKRREEKGIAVFSDAIGYVQIVHVGQLQKQAEHSDIVIQVNCVPGAFVTPDKPLVFIYGISESEDRDKIRKAFIIDKKRLFDEDPRFGLIALTEVASRALSPGINDPGTAIAIIGTHVRLLSLWFGTAYEKKDLKICDRVEVPGISVRDVFDDTFRPIARDGAANLEVMIRLQKALKMLYTIENSEVKNSVTYHAKEAMARAEIEMKLPNDFQKLKSESLPGQ